MLYRQCSCIFDAALTQSPSPPPPPKQKFICLYICSGRSMIGSLPTWGESVRKEGVDSPPPHWEGGGATHWVTTCGKRERGGTGLFRNFFQCVKPRDSGGGDNPLPPPQGRKRGGKGEHWWGVKVRRGYCGCKSLCCCFEVWNEAKSYIVRILLFGRWKGKASHDRCVSKGMEVKELYLYSTALS
jgi:hypothetical protein